jgi:type VI secretion system protein ImpL
MRWVLIVLVALILAGLWVGAFFVPDLRWFAEALTAAVVLPPIAILLFFWLRARLERTRASRDAGSRDPKARDTRPEALAVRAYLKRVLAEVRRMRGRTGAARLPWYVALGPPGAGRSSLLERAGFAVVSPGPLRGKLERTEAAFDLRCSAEAVVFEPPGHRMDMAETDSWIALLEALRRTRRKRTLEGIFAIVSIPDLIASNAADRRQLAGRMRARLDELLDRIAMVLPVYVVLTKADALTGFAEFWGDDPSREEGTWGASFAVDDDQAAHQPAKAIEKEFAVLGEGLHGRMIERLALEGDPARRIRVLRFPREVGALRAPLADFVEGLCQPGPALERFFLRGFYLTSAGSRATPDLAGSDSKGSFVMDVLRSVVLPDRNLAASTSNSLRNRSKFELRVSLIALAACLAVFAPALMSYLHNAELARTVQSAAEGLSIAGIERTPGTRGDPVEAALDALFRLESDSNQFGIRGWFGPRAARELHDPLVDAYVLRIHRWMLQKLRPALDKQLDAISWGAPLADAPSTPEESTPLRDAYEVVKLYATLTSPKGHANSEWASQRLAGAWRKLLPDEEVVDPAHLTEHARRYLQALDSRPELAWPAGPPLAGVRTRLRELQVQEMPYRRLLLWARDQPPLRASSAFGAASLEFLESRGDVQIPGVYTASGWQKIRDALSSPAPWPPEAVTERWVLDDAGIPQDDAGVRAAARQRYFSDYVGRWMRFLDELKVKTPQDIASAKLELVAFKGPEGFYRELFALFEQNVIRNDDPEPSPSLPKSLLSQVPWIGKIEPDAGAKAAPPSSVERAFRPILAFAGALQGDKGASPAPLDKYLAILDMLKAALDEAPSPKEPVQELQGPVAEAEAGVGELLDSTGEPTHGALLRLLMPPVRGSVLSKQQPGQKTVAEEWNSGVWTVWDQKLSKHFPFRSGDAVNFADFAAFFKPDGILWGFVHTYLSDAVEQKGDGHYASKGADPVTPSGLECLTVAQEITDAFFQGQDNGLRLSVQADWTAPDIKDAKFWVGQKDTALPQGQWSALLHWFGEDVRVEWQQGGRPTQEFGRHSFSLFDLFAHLGGLRPSPSARSLYAVDCPPLTLKVRSDGRVDPFRDDFFSRLRCPPQVRMARP